MKSNFLDQEKNRIERELYAEELKIKEAEAAYRNRIVCGHAPYPSDAVNWVAAIVAFILFFFLMRSVIGWFLRVIIGPALMWAVWKITDKIQWEIHYKRDCVYSDEYCRKKEASSENEKVKLAVARRKADENIREAEANYKREVGNARKAVLKERQKWKRVSDWLVSEFQKAIERANRAQYVQNIDVKFTFSVSSDRITTDSFNYVSITNEKDHIYGTGSTLWFIQDALINNITDRYNQIGFARAMAEIVMEKMEKRVPDDISDPATCPAKYEILKDECNDSDIAMRYTAGNANFAGLHTVVRKP